MDSRGISTFKTWEEISSPLGEDVSPKRTRFLVTAGSHTSPCRGLLFTYREDPVPRLWVKATSCDLFLAHPSAGQVTVVSTPVVVSHALSVLELPLRASVQAGDIAVPLQPILDYLISPCRLCENGLRG